MAASTLAVCILWGYFNDMESREGNGIPILIQRAYGHFRLWACTFKENTSFEKLLQSLDVLAEPFNMPMVQRQGF